MVRRLAYLIAVSATLTLSAQPPAPSTRPVFQQIDGIIKELSRITGWKPLRKVQYDVMNREQLRKYLDEKVRAENKPEEIRAQELTLRKFGLVPEGFDLAGSTINLMTEQAAAFYDEKRKKLFLLEGAEGPLEEVALVHELAHALADQQFDLGRFMKQKSKSDDSELARLAVVEGQATWLMSEHLALRTNQSLRTNPLLVRLMNISSDAASAQYPAFRDSPLYLRHLLLFPYSQGLAFQQAVLEKKGDQGFSEVFRHPPSTTQQMFHPDKYFSGIEPTHPSLAVVSESGEYRTISEGSVGEFDHTVLLEQYVQRDGAKELASHWRGGQYRLTEHKKSGKTVLCYSSEWDTPASAKQYFSDYREVLRGKWKTFRTTQERPDQYEGVGDDGRFIVELQGTVVRSREGLPDLQ